MNHYQCEFLYDKSILDSLEATLSPGRLALYRKFSGGNDTEALRLYCWNATLSKVLYWPLHAVEIALRNKMADLMYDHYGDNWYNKIGSFNRGRVANEEVQHVDKAKRKLDQNAVIYGHDKIVAAISMGFWEGLLKYEYEELLWKPH